VQQSLHERLVGDGVVDEDDEWCAEGVCFCDGEAVVIERFCAVGGGGGREEVAVVERDDGQALVAEQLVGLLDVAVGEGVALDGDVFHAGLGEFLRGGFDRSWLGGDRVDVEVVQIGKGRGRIHGISNKAYM
jgi:hypothetical protein